MTVFERRFAAGPARLMLPALAFAAALLAVLFVLPGSAPGRASLLSLVVLGAATMAMAACALAARAIPGVFKRPWLLFLAAATLAFVDQLATRFRGTEAGADLHIVLTAAAMVLLALAIGWLLQQRDRTQAIEIGLDASLMVAAVTVVTLHWGPGAAALAHGAPVSLVAVIAVLGAPVAAGCALLLAAVLTVVRAPAPGSQAAPSIAGAASLFCSAIAPLALGQGSCCMPGHWSGPVWAAGWLAVAYAGVRAASDGPSEFMPAGLDAGGSRLRLVVAPAVAGVMAAVLVDASWRSPMANATAVGMGVLGLVLALRVSQLLFSTRAHNAARIKLHQSRALIDVSHALARTRELEETLRLVAYWAVQLVQARGASIELLSDDGDWLETRAALGMPDGALETRFPVDRSFTGWVVRHGRARVTAHASEDETLHPASQQFLENSPLAAVPLRYAGTTMGTLSCVGRYPFTADDMELLGAFAEQAAVAIETARLFRQVHHLSLTDPLTGLANRRQLEKDLTREFAAARRGRQLVAVMFDLNGFKKFNDTEGHLMGDEALRRFAAALSAATRAMNMAARYGGDEFIALLADADAAGTEIFIERVRQRFPGPDAEPRFQHLTVAAGFAAYDPSMHDPSDLVAAADLALYRDKAAFAASSRTSK
jgi:diguanylate cyclase (GGDEF)-like protein